MSRRRSSGTLHRHCVPSVALVQTKRSSVAWLEKTQCVESRLPDSILLEIFCYLNKQQLGVVAQVSKRWRRVAYDKTFWHVLDLTSFSPDINEDVMIMIIKTRLISTLHSLNLGPVKLTAKIAKDLARKCPNLKCIVFNSVAISGDPAFSGESRQFPASLELMDIRHCRGDFQFMKRLPRHFTSMKYIGLGFQSSSCLIPCIFSKMHDLRVLDCTECEAINDCALEKISRSCRQLESICLNECKYVAGTTLATVVKHCKSLSTLLMRFTKISDVTILSVEWESTVIKELDITGCYYVTTTGLSTLLSHLPQLTYFKMNQCGFRHILNLLVYQEIRPQVNFTLLETLDLRWNFLLSAECLECILRLTPRLHYLGISHSPRVGPSAMMEMLPLVTQLKILEFGPLKKQALSDTNFVKGVISHCKEIEAVSFINFTVASAQDVEIIRELKQKCKKLQEVKLCNPRVEQVEVGAAGEMVTVERLLVKMESLLPSPKHTLNGVAKALC